MEINYALSCVTHCSKDLHMKLHLILITFSEMGTIIIPIFKWGDWGRGKPCNIPTLKEAELGYEPSQFPSRPTLPPTTCSMRGGGNSFLERKGSCSVFMNLCSSRKNPGVSGGAKHPSILAGLYIRVLPSSCWHTPKCRLFYLGFPPPRGRYEGWGYHSHPKGYQGSLNK